MDNTAAIESLRSFAVANGEAQFAHLCTAALAGEQWAVERVTEASETAAVEDLDIPAAVMTKARRKQAQERHLLIAIRATDTTRPDGAIARHCEAP